MPRAAVSLTLGVTVVGAGSPVVCEVAATASSSLTSTPHIGAVHRDAAVRLLEHHDRGVVPCRGITLDDLDHARVVWIDAERVAVAVEEVTRACLRRCAADRH